MLFFHPSLSSLQRTLSELRDYQRKHEYWQLQQEKILTEQAQADVKLDQRVAYERLKIQQAVVHSGREYISMGQCKKDITPVC